ncbi:MAG: TfuA-like protein [Pseudomonadota bacterium]
MIVVFAGPTIAAAAIREVLPEADIRPPARAGDVYAACADGAAAIGLIDGYFDGVPSVWHKEILWALDRGIPVYGASSMGALRAAELHAFGMTGVGAIFDAYRDGVYEDDDEVALRHGPAELGYVALSEPMVNIRATLARAVTDGVIDGARADALIAQAKAMHFPDRAWDALLPQSDPLRTWLSTHAVDQKRVDARAMLTAMTQTAAGPRAFTFHHTAMWAALTRATETIHSREVQLILDQLRQDPAQYADLRRRAAAQLTHEAPDVMQADVDRALTRFRTAHQLYTGRALDAWLHARDMELIDLRDSFAIDLRLTAVIAQNRDSYHAALIETLRADGSYARLRNTARDMAAQLDAATAPDLPPASLTLWYFETVRGMPIPDDLDAYMAQNDFADRADFEQMMARAHVLWHIRA